MSKKAGLPTAVARKTGKTFQAKGNFAKDTSSKIKSLKNKATTLYNKHKDQTAIVGGAAAGVTAGSTLVHKGAKETNARNIDKQMSSFRDKAAKRSAKK